MVKKYKHFNIRISHELWVFVKNYCVDNDTKISQVVLRHFEKLRRKSEKNNEIVEKDVDAQTAL